MAGRLRLVRGRDRSLLQISAPDDADNNMDIVEKRVVAEGNADPPSFAPPPDTSAMPLGDVIEDDDLSLDLYESLVNSVPLANPPTLTSRSFPREIVTYVQGVVSLLDPLLRRRGINVQPEWLASCVLEMEGLHPGFSSFLVEKQCELIFAHLLVSDLNDVGTGCLPDSFESFHATELTGPFFLQVDEISDIGASLRERYHERGSIISRCLKLSITDGVQRAVGIEYQPISRLLNSFPAGLKICVRNVHVRRGVLILNCDSVQVLGGLVQRLEEVRQRAVQEVNQPARSSRNRRGQTEHPSLVERATAEAWLRNTHGTSQSVS